MICFRDMTFCSAECATVDCVRQYTDDTHAEALLWWDTFNCGGDVPVAFTDFSMGCEEYEMTEEKIEALAYERAAQKDHQG